MKLISYSLRLHADPLYPVITGDPAQIVRGDTIHEHGCTPHSAHHAVALKQADVEVLRREAERDRDSHRRPSAERGLERWIDALGRGHSKKQFPATPRNCHHKEEDRRPVP